MKAITFFEEDREPTPDKPNKIITGIVDDNAEMYINRLEQENKQLNNILEELEQYCLDEQIPAEYPDYNQFVEIKNMAYDDIYKKIQEMRKKYE
jgi:hypothetical protein